VGRCRDETGEYCTGRVMGQHIILSRLFQRLTRTALGDQAVSFTPTK
jgi:hypothetical protein